MPIHDLQQVQMQANNELHDEDYKAAVKLEKERLRKKKAFLFPKRLRFQWPLRLENHHQPLNRRKSDRGRTR